MATPANSYTRLTRNAAGVGTYSSVWLANDHLLIVTSTGYNETYARVMLRDIRGLFVTRTDRRLWWGFFWGAIGLIFAIRAIVTLTYREAPIVSGIFTAVFAGALIANHLIGTGCAVHVVTGVQTIRLPSLVRWKKTRRVLDRLEPLIRGAQADLVPTPAPLPEVQTPIPPAATTG